MNDRSKGPLAGEQKERLPSELFSLPHKILTHHDADNLVALVLHELGHHEGFGISKASYLIDNPDFNCMRGLAGYSHQECVQHKRDPWQDPASFGADMKDAEYHQRTNSFLGKSITTDDGKAIDEQILQDLAGALGMQNPSYFTWRMRHGNNGVLLFEDHGMYIAHHRDLLHNFAAFLSLC